MSVEVDALLHVLRAALVEVGGGEAPPLLVRARLADLHRDLGVDAPSHDALDDATAFLDDEAWRRLWLLVALGEALGEALRETLRAGVWRSAFVELADDLDLLTLELLRDTHARREELCRNWLMRLGVAVTGETPEESVAALERLDYARLVARVDAARARADERLAYLRKLQADR